jgi:hypothetical protein
MGGSADLGRRPWVRLQPGSCLDEGRDYGPVELAVVIACLMYFFAAFALLAAIAFGLYAKRYKMVDHYRSTESARAPAAVKA